MYYILTAFIGGFHSSAEQTSLKGVASIDGTHRGNSGRNILRADGYQNVDLSLYKEFLITEQRKFQLRFEGFNALNLHSFTAPTAAVNDPNFGRIFGSSPARVMQVAAKFVY